MGWFDGKKNNNTVDTNPVGLLSLASSLGGPGETVETGPTQAQQIAEEQVALTYGNPQWLMAWHKFKSLPPTATNEELQVAIQNVVNSVNPMIINQLRMQRQQQTMYAQQMGGMQPMGMGGMGMQQQQMGMGGMGMQPMGMQPQQMGMGMGVGMGAGMGMMGMQQQPMQMQPMIQQPVATPVPATQTNPSQPAATDTPKTAG